MRRNRKVKIIATLGPASSTPEMIKKLFLAGADVFRINMSHATHEGLLERYNAIRAVEKEMDHPIAILCDLQGPKLRVGMFAEDALLEPGATFSFDQRDMPGDASRVYLPHPEIFEAVEPGHQLLLNDGKLRLTVTDKKPGKIETCVKVGGVLSNRKGISLPDSVLPMSPLTPVDRENLEYAADLGVDWMALSFVQRVEDVIEAKQLLQGRAAAMAKIEKPSAVADIDRIIKEADGIMVARGDLGVEMPLEQVPGVQKRLTRLARKHGKPVVVATQMLESMITEAVPTRAEVTDVATAVFEGADAIMLSAESAAGKYPEQSVATMTRVAAEVERDVLYDRIVHTEDPPIDDSAAGGISKAACSIAQDAGLAAIICYTTTGSTAYRISRHRPPQPILVLATSQVMVRRLAIGWGLHCVHTSDPHSVADMVTRACRLAAREKLVQEDDKVIITAGLPFGVPGQTNMLRVVRVDGHAVRYAENMLA
ncbi:MAG: pyruvate kinase, partial [Alphaproteobacteria bacterium]